MRGGLLTQERLGELMGLALGDRGYSGAAISDWERGKSKIHQDDRAVLAALILVLFECSGLRNSDDANRLLLSGNYRALDPIESGNIFPEQPVLEESAASKETKIPREIRGLAATAGTELSSKRRKQLILLEKVRSFWVEGVLNQSVTKAQMMQLEMSNCNELVDRPWPDHFGAHVHHEIPVPLGKILDAYFGADRALLILGEPGSGKTMTLIILAEKLIAQAVRNPIAPVPVILDLSSWAKQRQSIVDWVVEELTIKYQIPRRYGHEWLEDDNLILLLDGYDQLPIECRIPIARAINSFRETNGLTGIVICSRKEEYRLAAARLRLSGALELQPLSSSQIETYLNALGPGIERLQTAVHENPSIQTMARSPLMLNILSTVYGPPKEGEQKALQGPRINESSQQDSIPVTAQYNHLFSTYVQQMFRQRLSEGYYEQTEMKTLLTWLARQQKEHSQSVFLIEQLQPSWLPGRKWRWVYMLFSGFLLGLVGGFIIWLLWQLLRQTLPQLPAFNSAKLAVFLNLSQGLSEVITILLGNIILGLTVTLLLGIIFEYRLKNHTNLGSREQQRWRQVIVVGIATGSLTFFVVTWSSGLLFGVAWCVAETFMYMAAARYIFGWNYQQEVRPVEALGWSWRHAVNGLSIGLVLAILAEVIESLLYGYNGFARTFVTLVAAGLILGGLKGRLVKEKTRPNQGVWLSIRNAVLAALFVSLPLTIMTWFLRDPRYALTIGLLSAVIAASILGGSVIVKHFLLRIMLHWTADMPWRYASFLDHAARLTFLRKVGGGYIFMHRLLQDYFVEL